MADDRHPLSAALKVDFREFPHFVEKRLRPSPLSVQTGRHRTVADAAKPVAQRAQVTVSAIQPWQDEHWAPITPARTDTPEDGFDEQKPELRSRPPCFVREVGEA